MGDGTTVLLTTQDMNDIEVLLDKLEDDEDVQAVFTDVN